MSNENPGGQDALTRAEWEAMTPWQKGYAAYFQAAWNKAVPEANPYQTWTKEFNQYCAGQLAAALEAQEADD